MDILSVTFVVFVLVTLLGNFVLPQALRKPWLLLASYAFLASWSMGAALLLACLTVVHFAIGRALVRSAHPERWLWGGVVLDGVAFGALRVLTSPMLRMMAERGGWNSALNWMMPVGFSFYILQLAGYLFDLRAGRVERQHSLLDFSLYLAYFPKLLSGPVERGRDFLKRLQPLARPTGGQIRQGLKMMLMGLLRKVAIADALLWLFPEDLFSAPMQFSIIERAGWLLVFAFRLYNDFAGYTDMMRGLALLIGLPLGVNFREPFFARSLSEFWNRWHISLSAWLRDFIFYPLSRSLARRPWGAGWLRWVLPPLVTMLFSGFWHGASLAMLSWGGLHGLCLVWEQVGQRWAHRWPHVLEKLLFAPSRLRTQLIVLLLWVPFAAGDFGWALRFWGALLTPAGPVFLPAGWFWPLLLMMVSLGLDWAEERQFFERLPQTIQAATIGLGLVWVVLSFGGGLDVSGFVYQGF